MGAGSGDAIFIGKATGTPSVAASMVSATKSNFGYPLGKDSAVMVGLMIIITISCTV